MINMGSVFVQGSTSSENYINEAAEGDNQILEKDGDIDVDGYVYSEFSTSSTVAPSSGTVTPSTASNQTVDSSRVGTSYARTTVVGSGVNGSVARNAKTGDVVRNYGILIGVVVAGALLLIIGLWGNRKRDE